MNLQEEELRPPHRAQVVCKDLGKSGGAALSFESDVGEILLDGVRCSGGEVSVQAIQ